MVIRVIASDRAIEIRHLSLATVMGPRDRRVSAIMAGHSSGVRFGMMTGTASSCPEGTGRRVVGLFMQNSLPCSGNICV